MTMNARVPVNSEEFAAMMTSPARARKPTEKQLAAMRRTAKRIAAGIEPVPHDWVVREANTGPATEAVQDHADVLLEAFWALANRPELSMESRLIAVHWSDRISESIAKRLGQ